MKRLIKILLSGKFPTSDRTRISDSFRVPVFGRNRYAGLLTAVVLGGGLAAPAAIPEPDQVWYGRVLMTGGAGVPVRLTAGTLWWQIEPVSGGTPRVITVSLSNINDQFSYVLRVPQETPQPGVAATAGTVQLTSPATIYRRSNVTLDGQPLTIDSVPETFAPTLADRGQVFRIDLVLGSLPLDSDGDGLPDAWELQYFGSATGADPNEDSDGDGMTNLQEYLAGTNPRDPQSRFAMLEVSRLEGGGFRIRWSSQPGRRYLIQRATSLLPDGPGGFQTLQSGLDATPPVNEFNDSATGGSPRFFYRVRVHD